MALGGGGESGTCEKLRRISAARLTVTPRRMTAREGGRERGIFTLLCSRLKLMHAGGDWD